MYKFNCHKYVTINSRLEITKLYDNACRFQVASTNFEDKIPQNYTTKRFVALALSLSQRPGLTAIMVNFINIYFASDFFNKIDTHI